MPPSSEGAVLLSPMWSPGLTPVLALPQCSFLAALATVGISLVLWVLAMAPGAGFAGSTPFSRVLAAAVHLLADPQPMPM